MKAPSLNVAVIIETFAAKCQRNQNYRRDRKLLHQTILKLSRYILHTFVFDAVVFYGLYIPDSLFSSDGACTLRNGTVPEYVN